LPELLKLIIAIWGGLISLFVALLWLMGRSYARGYFQEAMGIPLYHIDLSIWEYGETAWLLVIVGILGFSAVSYVLYYAVRRNVLPKRPTVPPVAVGVVVIVIVVWVWGLLSQAEKIGTQVGRNEIMREGTSVEFTSESPLPLGAPTVITTTVDNQTIRIFSYTDLRLLTLNDGYYYVFRQVDPNTCQPERIYILKQDQLTQVQMSSSTAISSTCGVP
jgi:hypothetical protein